MQFPLSLLKSPTIVSSMGMTVDDFNIRCLGEANDSNGSFVLCEALPVVQCGTVSGAAIASSAKKEESVYFGQY